jgi:hypothetical protein
MVARSVAMTAHVPPALPGRARQILTFFVGVPSHKAAIRR